MAIIKCPTCGERMSTQWPSCRKCGGEPGKAKRSGRKFNPVPHYLLSATLASIGTLIYAAEFVGGGVEPGTLRAAVVMIFIGMGWYLAARVMAFMK